MKVEKIQVKLSYIITLETEEEARHLRGVLNNASCNKFKELPFDYALNSRMWSILDKGLEEGC